MKNFNLSPIGQKLLATQSAIAIETVQSMQPFMRDVMARSAQLAQGNVSGGAAPQAGAAR